MRKLVIVLLAVCLMVGIGYADQDKKVLANAVVLDKTTTNTGWLTNNISDMKRVSYFVTMDSSSTTTAVTTQVTAQISADGTNWTDARWYDLAGGTTLQTTETLSTDGTYLMWLDSNVPVPQVRIKILTEKASAWPADSATMTVTLVENK